MPIRSILKTLPHISARRFSTGLRGAIKPASRICKLWSGAGRAFRFNFPLGESGSSSRNTKTEGTINSGNFGLRKSRSSEGVGAGAPLGTKYAARRLSPEMGSNTAATTSRNCGCCPNTDSISPSSIRNPRSLIW